MPISLETQLSRWMKLLGMTVSSTYLKDQLQSHPDYPSLLSITDTLEGLHIPNAAAVVEKEKLQEIPPPFLAYIEKEGGYYELVTDVNSFGRKDSPLYQDWSGIIVAAEKPAVLFHPENSQALRRDRIQNYLWISLALLLSVITILSLRSSWSIGPAVLYAGALAGIGIAALIVQQELGMNTGFSKTFCDLGKNWDCNSLIQSSDARPLRWAGWSDIGIIYFCSQWIALIAAASGNASPAMFALFKLMSFASLPFIAYSLYYQARIVRKWCPLCLMTLLILLIQCISLTLFQKGVEVDGRSAATLFAAFTLITVLWTLFRTLLKDKFRIEGEWTAQLRFKKSPEIFLSFLKQQRRVDSTPFTHELEMANPNAAISVMVACGPYCGPCAKTHEILDTLVDKYKDRISLSVRFAIQDLDGEKGRTKAVKYILEQLTALQMKGSPNTTAVKNILHDWFKDMELETFIRSYPVIKGIDVSHQLREHFEWTTASDIEHTPTIFINGFELPKPYIVQDLELLLPFISENIPSHDLSPEIV